MHEPQVNIFTPANQWENMGLAPLSFPGNSGSAAAGEIRQGEEPTTAMNSTSNLGGNPGLAHIQYPSAGDREDDTTDCAPPSWSNSLVPLNELPRVLFTA